MCTKRQVATLEQQKLTATGLGGSLGQREGHGRDKAGSTPPVVPGAAPALAKAGVGGFLVGIHRVWMGMVCLYKASFWYILVTFKYMGLWLGDFQRRFTTPQVLTMMFQSPQL